MYVTASIYIIENFSIFSVYMARKRCDAKSTNLNEDDDMMLIRIPNANPQPILYVFIQQVRVLLSQLS